MTVIFIRTLIIFTTLIIIMRLMGKRQIGEMQPFEFIVTLIIADLACFPLADVSIPLIYGITAIICLFILHQILSLIEQSGDIPRRIISGKPSVVINKDGVDMLELKRNNLGVDDLIESMRSAGYFSLDDVEYAIFESNGKLSAMEKQNYQEKSSSLPMIIINNGKINHKNLSLIKDEKQSVIDFLERNGIKVKNTEVMTLDGNGKVYLKEINKRYKTLNFPLKEDVKW